MRRRGFLALAGGVGLAGAAGAQPIDVGPPLAVVTLRVSAADEAGYLHDLADYTNQYGFSTIGRPGGPQMDGRDVFLVWFQRDDGVTMLVTDITAPERMQAFFYPRKDGTAAAQTADLAQDYVARMGSYPAFATPGGKPAAP